MMPPDDPSDLTLLPWLLPPRSRPHLLCLLRFTYVARRLVRAPQGDAGETVARLRALDPTRHDPATDGEPGEEPGIAVARALARSIAATGVPGQHIRHFLQACEREAAGWSAETWSDLLVHARFAAASIGRHALAVLGESAAGAGAAGDALCMAAWILEDLRRIDASGGARRPLCIPRCFLTDAMITSDHLRSVAAHGQIRAVLDRVLDGVDHVLARAAPLPDVLTSRGSRRHARILICRARLLARRLRAEDPLATSVHLSARQRWRCLVLAVLPRYRPKTAA